MYKHKQVLKETIDKMIKLKAGVGVVNFERTFWKFSLAPKMN